MRNVFLCFVFCISFSGAVSAEYINVSFTGHINYIDPLYTGNIDHSSSIHGSIYFDKSLITGTGVESIGLDMDDLATLDFNLGDYVFNKYSVFDFGLGSPSVNFIDGVFQGVAFNIFEFEGLSGELAIHNDIVLAFEWLSLPDNYLLEGSIKYDYPSTSTVPLPPGVLLFVSGLIIFWSRVKRTNTVIDSE